MTGGGVAGIISLRAEKMAMGRFSPDQHPMDQLGSGPERSLAEATDALAGGSRFDIPRVLRLANGASSTRPDASKQAASLDWGLVPG